MVRQIVNTFFTRGLVAFLNLAIILISSQNLGSQEMGRINLLILNISIIQIINEIYTGYALVHFIPLKPLGSLVRNGILWTFASVLFLHLLYYAIDTFVQDVVEDGMMPHSVALSLLFILNSFHCVILLGKQRIKTYNTVLLLQPLLLCLFLLLNIFGRDLISAQAYVFALYPALLFCLLISSIGVWNLVKNDQTPDTSNKSVIANGFLNQLGNLAHTLTNRFNYYMIGSFSLLGVYANATSLIESVWIIGNSFAPVVLTRVANSKDYSSYSHTVLVCSKISLLLSILVVAVIVVLPEAFFVYFLGPDFAGVKTIMLALAPGILAISFSVIISHYFSGKGIQKIQVWANYSGLLLTLCLSHYAIARFGIIGAAYVASLSYIVQALVLSTVFFRQNRLGWSELFQLKGLFTLLGQLRKG